MFGRLAVLRRVPVPVVVGFATWLGLMIATIVSVPPSDGGMTEGILNGVAWIIFAILYLGPALLTGFIAGSIRRAFRFRPPRRRP